jgi:hypothetical protein
MEFGAPRVFLATGHNMLGFSLGPATGERIASLMTGAISDAALASFAPSRRGRLSCELKGHRKWLRAKPPRAARRAGGCGSARPHMPGQS